MPAGVLTQFIRRNCYMACIDHNCRKIFSRLYPVLLAREDGSTVRIMYSEPITLIKLPFDLSKIDEEERNKRLNKRQIGTKKVVVKTEDDEINFDRTAKFDSRDYINKKK